MSAHCEYYQELISRMLDGDLSDGETDALREHIRTCPECRVMATAFSGMALSLREDEAEPPGSLADSVMSRIHAYEGSKAVTKPEPISRHRRSPSHTKRKKPYFRSALVAACLVAVIGVGALTTVMSRGGSESEAMEAPATVFSRTTADTASNAGAGIPEAVMEAAPMEAAAPMAPEPAAAPMPEPEEAPADEAVEAETFDIQLFAEAGEVVPGYDLSCPAYVPAGFEAAFDGLISEGGQYPELNYQPFFYVEHNGVIYEFMTDDDGQYLLWRDAAEGFPHLSQGSFDDLWAIFK